MRFEYFCLQIYYMGYIVQTLKMARLNVRTCIGARFAPAHNMGAKPRRMRYL